MNAFIQLVSFDQGVQQFKLFELARCLIGGSAATEKFSWIGLNGRTGTANSITKLKPGVKFSQIGYETKFKPLKLKPGIILTEAFGVLQIPATSFLWAGSEYWNLSNVASGYRRARVAKRAELAIKRSKIEAFPAILELTLKFKTNLKQDALAAALVEVFSRLRDVKILNHLTCGVVDFGDAMLFSKMEILNLSAVEHSLVYFLHEYVLGTPLLKKRIDRLHAIHILEKDALSMIARRLKLPMPVDLGERLGLLSIPKAIIDDPNSNLSVAKLAIPRNVSTSWKGILKRGT